MYTSAIAITALFFCLTSVAQYEDVEKEINEAAEKQQAEIDRLVKMVEDNKKPKCAECKHPVHLPEACTEQDCYCGSKTCMTCGHDTHLPTPCVTQNCECGYQAYIAKPGTSPEPYTKTGFPKEIINVKTGIELVYVPAGNFTMGSPDTENGREPKYEVQRKVVIPKGFYMGKYEVTQAEWKRIMKKNPSFFHRVGDLAPVDKVSWYDCQEFLRKVGNGLRLPTEVEWEYACRAGKTGSYDGKAKLDDLGWFGNNSGRKPLDAKKLWDTKKDENDYADKLAVNRCTSYPVGQKKPNAWGLYDMHGNVWEWCSDDFVDDGKVMGKVVRGGSWASYDTRCRSARHDFDESEKRLYNIGFRVVVSADEVKLK